MAPLSGQSLCGAVRYRISGAPALVAICHCTHCRRQSGSAFSVNALIARTDYRQEGTTRVFTDTGSSGAPVYRQFCPGCGSPILSALPGLPDHILVKVGTLDNPEALTPSREVWCDSALPWLPVMPNTTRSGRDR